MVEWEEYLPKVCFAYVTVSVKIHLVRTSMRIEKIEI